MGSGIDAARAKALAMALAAEAAIQGVIDRRRSEANAAAVQPAQQVKVHVGRAPAGSRRGRQAAQAKGAVVAGATSANSPEVNAHNAEI